MSVLDDPHRVVGTIVCLHGDGDFVLTVHDLKHFSTGSCLIRQQGQGQTHDIVVTADEASKLADTLNRFARSQR
jgi:hypothetical protein